MLGSSETLKLQLHYLGQPGTVLVAETITACASHLPPT